MTNTLQPRSLSSTDELLYLGAILGEVKREIIFFDREAGGQWPDIVAPSPFKAAEDIWTALTVMDIIRV